MSTAVTGLERSRLAAALLRSPVERIVLLIWTVRDGIEGGFRRHQPKLTVQPCGGASRSGASGAPRRRRQKHVHAAKKERP